MSSNASRLDHAAPTLAHEPPGEQPEEGVLDPAAAGLGGAVLGAAAGASAGPIGAVIGAAAGAAVGAGLGAAADAVMRPDEEEAEQEDEGLL